MKYIVTILNSKSFAKKNELYNWNVRIREKFNETNFLASRGFLIV